MRRLAKPLLWAAFGLGLAIAATPSTQAQQKTLKMQATWPASLTLYENFLMWAERVDKLSGGSLKVEAMPAGQVVPAFEVLDATHKKVLDGAHAWGGYWTGKDKTAILFTGGPGGTSTICTEAWYLRPTAASAGRTASAISWLWRER